MNSDTQEQKEIFVTRSFSPPEEEFLPFVRRILESGQFTNNGPLLKTLEKELRAFFDVDFCQMVTNGTLALQLALRALEDESKTEVITTPFSYVATTSAILWERCTPVFVDIDPHTFCIDASKVATAVTSRTRAILPVHVFGYPCDVDTLADISRTTGVPVIYDAAHAFAAEYRGRSLISYGNLATCSFHATKLFHTIEGGCVVAHDAEMNRKIDLLKRFGHNFDDHIQLGMNAKSSEFQAAMGLTNLPHVPEIIADRKKTVELYDSLISGHVQRPVMPPDFRYNYAYYPVVFRSEAELLTVDAALRAENIHLRRYFYPSLNTLPYLPAYQPCPVSEDIAGRIACLPLYFGLEEDMVEKIAALCFLSLNKELV